MANRSYLYATNVIPGLQPEGEKIQLIGVSEWNYDIPLVYKLLMSYETETCKSSIWNNAEKIAVVADLDRGIIKLKDFFNKINSPLAKPLIEEALNFLKKYESQYKYFVLEVGEIFVLHDEPLEVQMPRLLSEIGSVEFDSIRIISTLEPKANMGLIENISNLISRKKEEKPDPMKAIYHLGLGNWSSVLYFDFSNA